MIIIFQMVFSQQDVNNMFLYNNMTSHTFIIKISRIFFQAVPSFTFSVCFGALVKIAATHLDANLLQWVKGRQFGWDDFII